MSNKLIDASLKLKGMSSTCKLVLLVLANSARDDKGGSCWPSISVIAESCCLSDRAVRNALKWLVKSGAITSKRQFNSSSIYTVTPEHYSIVALNSPPEQCAAPPCTTFTPPLNNVPNKLNLNVTETELKKEKSAREVFENPPPEPEPAYAKTDIQQPHTDNRTMFEMSLDWKPTANINGVLKFNGLPWSIDTIPNDRFVEFVTHWHGKPDRKTQDGWHRALVGWLKRTQISPASSARCRPAALGS